MQSSSVGVSAELPAEDISGEVKDDEPPPPHADINRSAVQPKATKYRAKTRDIGYYGCLTETFIKASPRLAT